MVRACASHLRHFYRSGECRLVSRLCVTTRPTDVRQLGRQGSEHRARHNGSVSNRLRVLILGSTGSIGTQALEVIAANPDRFEVVGLAAGGGNPALLARQRAETGRHHVAVADEAAAAQVGDVTYAGPDAVTRLVENTEAEPTSCSTRSSARSASKPTLAALAGGARLALANKESLVAGGPLVLKAAKPGQIVPVDSEHSAMAQCLRGGTPDEVAKIVLTASGGPFRGWSAERPRDGHPGAGRSAPHLVDGPDEHAQLGDAGQQGPRADRDASAVRHRLRPHRGRGPPAVDRALDGHLHRRLDPRAGQPAGHEAADRAGAGLAGPRARRGAGLRLQHRLDLGVRAAGCAVFPGRRPGARARAGRRLPDRGLQRSQRGSGGGVP